MAGDIRLPYPGLRAFSRDESDLFFGREGCVDAMVDRLAATRFLAVLGASGSGKSSLVRTGLFDALEIGLHAAGTRWRIVDMHPGGQPMRNLAAGLQGLIAEQPGATDVDLLKGFLARGPRSIVEWCLDGHLEPDWNLLILVDQFEELFRYQDYSQREEAEAFIALLLESSRAPDAPINVILTMRSEYLGACALVPGLAERINAGLYLTPRMTREECRQAIEGPAGVAGITVEKGLVNQLLNDMTSFAPWDRQDGFDQLQVLSRRADQLPLMQHVLNRLWLRAAAAGSGPVKLTLRDYERIGGLRGALDSHAAEVLDGFTEPQRQVVQPIFRALVSGNSLQNAVRRPCGFADLVRYADCDAGTAAAVVNAFRASGCNFLQPPSSEPLHDGTVVDISHESLIRQWSLLSEWFEHEARSAQTWLRLISAEEHHARGEGDLLGGLDLANLEAWWQREKPNAAWAERYGGHFLEAQRFLELSKNAERSRVEALRRRQTRTFTAVVALLVIFAALSAFAGFQVLQNQKVNVALRATNDQLTRQSVALNDKNAQLTKLTGDLRAEEQEALREKQTAQQAYDFAIQSADRFLTGMADRLLVTPGVPKGDIARILKEGDDFLAHLSGSSGSGANPKLLARARARAALKFAEIDEARGEFPSMSARAQGARAILLANRVEADLDAEDLLLLAQAQLVEGRASIDAGQRAKAGGDESRAMAAYHAAMQPLQEAARLIAKVRDADRASQAAAEIAGVAFFWSGQDELLQHRHADAMAAGRDCLAVLTVGDAAAMSPLAHLFAARCHGMIAAALLEMRDGKDPDGAAAKRYDAAVAEIEKIVESGRNNDALEVLASAQSSLGRLAEGGKDSGAPLKWLNAALKTMQELSERNPLEYRYNDLLARYYYDKARYVQSSVKDYRKAVEFYRSAYSVQPPYAIDQQNAAYLRRRDKLLAAMIDAIEYIDKFRDDRDILGTYMDALQEYLQVEQDLAQVDPAVDRSDVVLESKTSLAQARLVSSRQAESGSAPARELFESALALSKEALAVCDAGYDHNNLSPRAKRICFQALTQLPQERSDVSYAQDIETKIADLDWSRERLSAFLNRFPDVWLAEHDLAVVSAELAKLYVEKGDKARALDGAEAAAALYGKEGIQLLIDWYTSGQGPVAADPRKAAEYRARFDARDWDFARYTAHVRLVSDGDQAPFDSTWNIWFMDPRFPGDKPIARTLRQLQDFDAREADPKDIAKIQRIFDQAVAAKRSFVESLQLEAGVSNDPGTIAIAVRSALDASDVDKAARIIEEEWASDGGEDNVEASLHQIVNGPDPGVPVRDRLLQVAARLSARGVDPASIEIVSVLLESGGGTAPETASLYKQRAEYRLRLGDIALAAAESDLQAALALAPDDLASIDKLGYLWVEENKFPSAAIALLERAAAADPDNPEIKDSLGWAYVKNGQHDKGLALIAAASAERPSDPRALAHLAEAHRRGGDLDGARAEFSKALTLSPEDAVFGFIVTHRAMLDRPPARDAHAGDDDTAALAAAIRQAGFWRDVAMSTDAQGVAINGFDPVAFFTEKRAAQGSAAYFHIWGGAIWLFTSAANRDRFAATPDRYAPVFGGYCAFCMAGGNKVHGDPAASWVIYEGRLYLHAQANFRADWLKEPSRLIRLGQLHWKDLASKGVAPASPTDAAVRLVARQRAAMSAAFAGGHYADALRLDEEYAADVEAEEVKSSGQAGPSTAQALVSVSWYALFAREFAKALEVAERGHSLAPADLPTETNHAHALMFLGRLDEARAIYAAHRGERIGGNDGKLWEQIIADDFAALRKAGIEASAMPSILQLLAEK
jgi:Flp pilus assembly protein TadD